MESSKRSRLEDLCKKIWIQLTNEEKERYFFGEGTIEFVADVADILGIDSNALTEDELDTLLNDLDN